MQHTAHHFVPDTAGFAQPEGNASLLAIQPGMSVADFGAGSGAYIWPIARTLANSGHLFAIDVQQDLLRRIHNEAQKRGITNLKILWADLEKPKGSKIAKESLDVVLISNLLFQVEDKNAVLAEAHRILKPSGKLAVIDWSDSFGGMGPHKNAVVTKQAGATLIQKNGFRIDFAFPAGAHHWGIVAYPMRI
ncbi:MAG TPA: methyltransferase domain-containing protein [Candidatus Paceibacterota bacterium]|nr:methyltransferase domain-containing protein [Candidatus Paceibacterota bacterium]